jgi:restriction endonuclease S subunit
VTELALHECSFRKNKFGDVLIAMYGATIGKVAILATNAVTNQAVLGCTPHDYVYNRFLFYFLLSQKQNFMNMSEGGAQPNISKVKIQSYPIPLPPLAEQRRIVAKVDALMALVDQLEAQQAQAQVTASALLEALVAAGGRVMKEPQALVAIRALRDFFEHSVLLRTELYDNRFSGQWLLFHTALDTLEDGLIAVDKFRQNSAEHIRLNPLLALSGFLQLLYVQLDTVKFLSESFQSKTSKKKKFFDQHILKIRYLRNHTFGHPVKNTSGDDNIAEGKITYTLMSKNLIYDSHAEYLLQFGNGDIQHREFRYTEIYAQVDAFIHTKISTLLEQLHQAEQQHKAKFSNSKLAIFNLSTMTGIKVV